MPEKIKLKIITPEKVIFDGEVDEVLVPGIEGELGILPKHVSLLTALKAGELRMKKEGNWDNFAIMGGFVEVMPDSSVKILANSAEHAKDIDEARAIQAKEKAESLLKEKREDVKFTEAAAAMERALVRLKVAQRKRKHKSEAL